MKNSIKLLLILSLLFIAGCGYTTGALLPSNLKTIYVDSFANKIDISRESSDRQEYEIYRSGMESDVTNAIIDQFIFDGNLSITGSDEADLVLTGDLIDYAKEALRYDRFDNVEEYRVLVVVNILLMDTAKDEASWRENGFTGETTYRTSGSLAKGEDEAIDDAIGDLAERIVERTTEGW